MNIPLEQQYQYLNWRRQVELARLRYIVESKAHQSYIAQRIQAYIISGNDPATNPDLSGDYFYFIDEFGDSFFLSEDESFSIHKEEDEDPTTNHYTNLN